MEFFSQEDDFTLVSQEDFTSILAAAYIFCIASGEVNGTTKYYLYGKDSSERRVFLLEVVVNQESEAKLTFKTNSRSPEDGTNFINYFFNVISPILTVI